MSVKFKIAETENFSKSIQSPQFKSISKKIKSYIYPQLIENPFYGNNIKKLKGKFDDIYRYRIGNYRLFYTIDIDKIIVFIIDIIHRKDSYKK